MRNFLLIFLLVTPVILGGCIESKFNETQDKAEARKQYLLNLRIPRVHFENATLREIGIWLAAEIKRLDETHEGIRLVVKADIPLIDQSKYNIDLRDVPFSFLLGWFRLDIDVGFDGRVLILGDDPVLRRLYKNEPNPPIIEPKALKRK